MSKRRVVRAGLLSFRLLAASLVLAVAPAIAYGQAASSGLPPGVYPAEQDYRLALAGTYGLDPYHAAVIARVSHLGYSYSIFRFDRLDATLTWDPANLNGSSLSAKVETASITSNVKGFSEQLAGNDFLKSAAFPEATFVSTAFRQSGPRSGKVDGTLTLLGKTKPVTFDVELVGAGKGLTGQPRIGATARASIVPVDFGLMPLLGPAIEIVADVEFEEETMNAPLDAPNGISKPVAGELVVTRDIAAPRARVFAAWTDERLAARWWAPRDFVPLSCTIDPRPGGVWHRRMRAPDGTVIVKHGVYREIVVPERLVFTYMTEDAAGAIDRETLVTVTFDDLGRDGPSSRTRLTLRHTAFASEEARLDHQGGWTGCLERCATFFEALRDAA